MIERGREKPVLCPTIIAAMAIGAALSACAVPTDMPQLLSVLPARAYSDVPLVLRVDTRHLRPALRIDAQGGAQSPDLRSLRMRLTPQDTEPGSSVAPLEIVRWDGMERYWIRLPPGVVAGTYALELTDARGTTVTLPDAFVGLGPDTIAPTIEVTGLSPGGTVGSGSDVSVDVMANDSPGLLESIHWQVGDGEERECFTAPEIDAATAAVATAAAPPPPPRSFGSCKVPFKAPVLGDAQPIVVPLSLRLRARDLAGNEAVRELPLQVAKTPVVDTFVARMGALGGRQPFTVRGRFFIPGSEAILGGVPIIGGVLTEYEDGSGVISGWTPPRARAEPVIVQVRSPAGLGQGDMSFVYLAPPRPRDIQPPTGPTRGGISVTVRGNDLRPGAVVVYVGASREVRQPLYNVSSDIGNKVIGCVPPGTGTVSLWAYDPLTGDGELPLSFTYQDPPAGGDPLPPIDSACVPR